MIAPVLDQDVREQEPIPSAPRPAPIAKRTLRYNHWATNVPDDVLPVPKFEPLPYLVEAKLFKLAQDGDIDARNTLWLRNARLAFSVANLFRVPPQLLPDLVQEGIIGLHRAIERYDVHRYNSFSTYAWHWIRNRAQRSLWSSRFSTRIPAHLYRDYLAFRHHQQKGNAAYCQRIREWQPELYATYRRLMAVHDAEPLGRTHENLIDPHCLVADKDDATKAAIESNLAKLRPRSADIIRRRFGLTGEPRQTLRQIAQSYNLTRERIRQLEAAALRKLRNYITKAVRTDRRHILADFVAAPTINMGVPATI